MSASIRGTETRRVVAAVAATILLVGLWAAPAAPGKGGTVDRTFGSNGHVVTDVGLVESKEWRSLKVASARTADGRLFLAAAGADPSQSATLTAYLPNGKLDTGFGSGGRLQLGPLTGPFRLGGITADAAGRLVIAGTSAVTQGPPSAGGPGEVEPLEVLRLLPNGAPDAGFGEGGVVTRTVQATNGQGFTIPSTALVSGVAVDPAGAVVLAGTAFVWTTYCPSQGAFVVRLTESGTVDRSFGVGGEFDYPGGVFSNPSAPVLDPSGGVLLSGAGLGCRSDPTFAAGLSRLTAAGTPDPSFGEGNGMLAQRNRVRDFALDSQGRILVLTEASRVMRLLPTGARDASFSVKGLAALPQRTGPIARTEPTAIAVTGNGGVLVTGTQEVGTKKPYAKRAFLARLSAGGEFVRGFGEAGVAVPLLSKGVSAGTGVMIDGSGRAFVFGPARASSTRPAAMALFGFDL